MTKKQQNNSKAAQLDQDSALSFGLGLVFFIFVLFSLITFSLLAYSTLYWPRKCTRNVNRHFR